MPPLTWRNVEAPNLTPAISGLRTAGEMINDATSSAIASVDDFIKTRSEAADKAILGRALGFTDSASFDAALKGGSLLGSQGGQASMELMKFLDQRRGTLLQNDQDKLDLEKAQYDHTRLRDLNAVLDKAGPTFLKAAGVAGQGNDRGALGILQADPNLANLPADKLMGFLKDFSDLSSKGVDREQGRAAAASSRASAANTYLNMQLAKEDQAFQNEERDRTRKSWNREDEARANQEEVDRLYTEARIRNPTEEGMQAEVVKLYNAGAPPKVVQAFEERAKADGYAGLETKPSEVPSAAAQAIDLAANHIERKLSQDINNVVLPGATPEMMTQAYKDTTSTPNDVAQRLTGKGGPLEGSDTNAVFKEVMWFVERGYSPAIAGLLVNAATRPTNWYALGNQFDGIGEGRQVDGGTQRALIEQFPSSFFTQGAAVDTLGGLLQSVQAARAKAKQSQNELEALRRRPGVAAETIAAAVRKAEGDTALFEGLVDQAEKVKVRRGP